MDKQDKRDEQDVIENITPNMIRGRNDDSR